MIIIFQTHSLGTKLLIAQGDLWQALQLHMLSCEEKKPVPRSQWVPPRERFGPALRSASQAAPEPSRGTASLCSFGFSCALGTLFFSLSAPFSSPQNCCGNGRLAGILEIITHRSINKVLWMFRMEAATEMQNTVDFYLFFPLQFLLTFNNLGG